MRFARPRSRNSPSAGVRASGRIESQPERLGIRLRKNLRGWSFVLAVSFQLETFLVKMTQIIENIQVVPRGTVSRFESCVGPRGRLDDRRGRRLIRLQFASTPGSAWGGPGHRPLVQRIFVEQGSNPREDRDGGEGLLDQFNARGLESVSREGLIRKSGHEEHAKVWA